MKALNVFDTTNRIVDHDNRSPDHAEAGPRFARIPEYVEHAKVPTIDETEPRQRNIEARHSAEHNDYQSRLGDTSFDHVCWTASIELR